MEGQQLGYVGLEEAARRLGVAYWRVRHAHRAGHVPEPPRIGTRRVYDEAMLETLRAYFTVKDAEEPRPVDVAAATTEARKEAHG